MSGLTNHATDGDPAVPRSSTTAADAAASDLNVFPNADCWRVEVAARVERYRTRRKPRAPHYPSLLLPFDAPETWSRPAPPSGSTAGATVAAQVEQDFACRAKEAAGGTPSLAEPHQTSEPAPYRYPEESAKVIEFPRSAAIPVYHASELADPVFDYDRPRIVEAPEILPPPPALGGMLIESAQQEPADRQGADSPLPGYHSASITRRAFAAFVDGVVLATALAAFAAIFLRLNPSLNPDLNLSLSLVRGPLLMLAAALGLVALLFWMAYEFLFVVYTGSTPGLRAARLRLAGFDGLPLSRRSRLWRVLASFLSAFSAGLGYLWCVLDQDGLCWHDRITRTHIQSESPAE
ncbi:MAG: RDD family protein [Terriglobales bacterium]